MSVLLQVAKNYNLCHMLVFNAVRVTKFDDAFLHRQDITIITETWLYIFLPLYVIIIFCTLSRI